MADANQHYYIESCLASWVFLASKERCSFLSWLCRSPKTREGVPGLPPFFLVELGLLLMVNHLIVMVFKISEGLHRFGCSFWRWSGINLLTRRFLPKYWPLIGISGSIFRLGGLDLPQLLWSLGRSLIIRCSLRFTRSVVVSLAFVGCVLLFRIPEPGVAFLLQQLAELLLGVEQVVDDLVEVLVGLVVVDVEKARLHTFPFWVEQLHLG